MPTPRPPTAAPGNVTPCQERGVALVMALVFQRLAPPRLTLRQAGLTVAVWLGLGALLLAVLLIVGR